MVGGSSAGPGADSKIIHHEDGEPITSQGVLPGLGLAPCTLHAEILENFVIWAKAVQRNDVWFKRSELGQIDNTKC